MRKIFNPKIIGFFIKNTILDIRSLFDSSHPIHYRISSVDQENQTAVLHVINKSIFITQTFSEIISNKEVIEGLSSENACWIGIYYGIALRKAMDRKGNLKNVRKPSYLLTHRHGSYKIVCENRDGTIGCVHVKSRKELNNIDPLSIAQDDLFLKQFDATQACYIGILAGIKIEKLRSHSSQEIKKIKVPYLRLVK